MTRPFTRHELLTSFDGVRYLVLGTMDEAIYARDMAAVVNAMAGMDCAGVLEFEFNDFLRKCLRTFDASEPAALAWLQAHERDIEWDGDEPVVPAFIQEHCADELSEMAGARAEEAEGQRDIERSYRSSVL